MTTSHQALLFSLRGLLKELKTKINNISLPQPITFDDLELITQEYYQNWLDLLRSENPHSQYEPQFPSDELLDRLHAYETVTRDNLRRIFGWYGKALNQFFITYDVEKYANNGLERIKLHRENFMIHA